jgi:hypothetical protein
LRLNLTNYYCFLSKSGARSNDRSKRNFVNILKKLQELNWTAESF